MFRILFVAICFFLSFNASADNEWTGSKKDGMYSEVVIQDVHTGVVDSKPYFCIKAVKTDVNLSACLVSGYSIWSPAFDTFYNQAMYYYSTGQKIRVYYEPNIWKHKEFSKITTNAIAGFSTCFIEDQCFGPDRKPKPSSGN
ncbi:subtilase family AB5 toxin binding subunit [Escherichia coli]|uniref:subtilase family AB5 toxin binding subunit n=1 Tax=Escherichia coli TaxID=562 RepID=UPI000BE20F0A|nr:subtilase family AB5 toxin binding subunit [Escherichia coli]